jgi:hypothetical protein
MTCIGAHGGSFCFFRVIKSKLNQVLLRHTCIVAGVSNRNSTFLNGQLKIQPNPTPKIQKSLCSIQSFIKSKIQKKIDFLSYPM